VKEQCSAVVIGGHFQGLGVVRALAREGVPVVLLDHEPCLARFSRHVTRFFRCPDISNEGESLDFFERISDREGLKGAVVFATDDETVHFLSRHRDVLGRLYRITTPEWDVVKWVFQKRNTYPLAESLGIPAPRTWYPADENGLDRIGGLYPLLIKPSVMRTFFKATGKKVFRAANRTELKEAYRRACSIVPSDEIMVQEEIPNVARNLYSFCPLFERDRTLAHVTAKRSRQHPMDFGHATTFAESVCIPELERLGSRFLASIRYQGLCEVEFIMDERDGLYKLLEVNPRIWGWHTLAIRAGVNLPYFQYLQALGRPVCAPSPRTGVKWIRLVTDVATSFSEIAKGRLSLRHYLESLKGDKEWDVFSLNDPLPFFGEIVLLPYLLSKRGF
jgi:D-aspartate ligase